MEFTKEFIEEQKLSEEQVKNITTFATEQVATLKKDWDSKANNDAESILTGAIDYAQKENSHTLERQQGEKAGAYFKRFADSLLSTQKSDLVKAKSDYEEKIKGVKGNEALTTEYEKLKVTNDDLLKKYADYDIVKELSEKAEGYKGELSGLKLEVSFNSIKPSFPDTVNKYEAKALWNEFKNDVLAKNTIEIVDGVPMAVDKENRHKIIKLEDVLDKNEPIKTLMAGRTQTGTGATQIDLLKIDGVPFEVPENASNQEISQLIKNSLTKQGIGQMHPEFVKKFQELNTKIQVKQPV